MRKTNAQLEEEARVARRERDEAKRLLDDSLKLDEAYRKELTIALGTSMIDISSYDRGLSLSSREPAKPLSWSQIFVEIGRLRETKDRDGRFARVDGLIREAGELTGALREAARRARPRRCDCGRPDCPDSRSTI